MLIWSITFLILASVTVVAISSSAWSRRRKATEWIAVLASAGSLNNKVAERSISASFDLEISSEGSSHPLFLSQDRASFAKVTGLGDTVICASRSARVEKLRVLCAEVLFGLMLDLQEAVRGPVFYLKKSPMAYKIRDDQVPARVSHREAQGGKRTAVGREGVLPQRKREVKNATWTNSTEDPGGVPAGKKSRSIRQLPSNIYLPVFGLFPTPSEHVMWPLPFLLFIQFPTLYKFLIIRYLVIWFQMKP